MKRILGPVARYHRYAAVGLDHVPKEGPVLLVMHHSLATYDSLLLCAALYERTGRVATGLGDDLIFKIPGVGRVASEIGIRPASPVNGVRLLEQGHVVVVAPGGMKEALRSSEDRYRVQWGDRRGFVRLALQTQVPMVLAACPAADDLFTVADSPLTQLAYQQFKIPVPLVKGRSGLPVPRAVPLTHYLAAPVVPTVDDDVDGLHARCVTVMEGLLAKRWDPPPEDDAFRLYA